MMCSGGLGSDNADVKLRQLQLCSRAAALLRYCANALLRYCAMALLCLVFLGFGIGLCLIDVSISVSVSVSCAEGVLLVAIAVVQKDH